MTCGIYCIENKITNKKYIGQSRDTEKRIKKHTYNLLKHNHSNPHLNDSFQKYGIENFSFYILSVCEEKDLDGLEKHYISIYNSNNRAYGYNILSGGGGTSGRVVSEKTKAKLSIASKGRKYSQERNKKISDAKKGKPKLLSKEHRAKITEANTGIKISTRKTTSPFLGVSYCRRDKRWRVYFKGIPYGSFLNEILAAKKYDEVSWKILHDLSKLNFPKEYAKKGIKNATQDS